MTSDAKIGLLLGLVFIFIIAFVINGLPSFRTRADANAQMNEMLDAQNRSLGIAEKARNAIELNEPMIRYTGPVPPAPAETEPRYTIPLPSGSPLGGQPGAPAANPPAPAQPGLPSVQVWPKVYTVGRDDSLAAIAQKFYGPEEGNRRVNVMRIFEANSRILKSPHEIFVGQKLVIPALPGTSQPQQSGIFSGSMFETRRSIGEILLGGSSARAVGEYVVKEGENLWKIAARQLGDGNRYKEIFKLNKDRLEDEDSVVAGMSLRMPAR
jgi:nucleoid-associated protein YgaU